MSGRRPFAGLSGGLKTSEKQPKGGGLFVLPILSGAIAWMVGIPFAWAYWIVAFPPGPPAGMIIRFVVAGTFALFWPLTVLIKFWEWVL